MNNTLTLTIRANATALQAALKTAQSSIKTFSKSIGKTVSSNAVDMRDAFNTAGKSIESTIKRVGAVAIGSSFGVAAFVKSASELQSLRASFQSLTGTIENTNSVMNMLYRYGKETAFDNKSIQASAKMFLANGVAVKDLMGWMRNLGDVAGATGANLQGLALPITQAIGTGKVLTQDWYQIINQGAGGLQKYIIAALGAGHSVKTFKDDLEKGRVTVDVMRRALQMASAEGGMAFQGALKQSQTFNGRLSNLQEAITNVGLSILGVDAATGEVKAGGLFDKISKSVENTTKWLEDNKETILKVASVIQDNLVPATVALGSAFVAMKIGKMIMGFLQFISALKTGVTVMAALNAVTAINPFILVAAAIAAVIAALVFLQVKFNIFGKAWDAIKAAWGTAISWFKGIFSGISSIIGLFVGSVLGFFQGIWDGIVDVFNNIVAFIQNWGLTILAVIFAPISLVIGIFFTFKDQIIAIFNSVVSVIRNIWNSIVSVFSTIFNIIWGIIKFYINAWINIFKFAWSVIAAVFSGVANFFTGIFQGAWNGIKAVFSGVGNFFRGVWNTIVNIFTSVGTAIGNAISGAVKGVVNAILGFAEGAINTFIKAINVAIGIINAIPGVHIPVVAELKIPRLASGGIVGPQGGGSIIYAGDGGQNEWVVPESKMASLVRQINARGGGGASEVNITVNVATRDEKFSDSDAVDIAQKINRALKAQGLRLDQMGALR